MRPAIFRFNTEKINSQSCFRELAWQRTDSQLSCFSYLSVLIFTVYGTVSLLIFFRHASRPCDFQRYRSAKNRWYFLLGDVLLSSLFSVFRLCNFLAPNLRSKEFSRAWILPMLPTFLIERPEKNAYQSFKKCCGSMNAYPCLWLMDPDPDPAIFVIDLQDANKK